MPNPDLRQSQGAWSIWTRFLFAQKEGTVPVDPIPVRTLTRAALDALDPGAVHIVRLGHSSHLLKIRGRYWLIDPVFGSRASPVSFAGPKRFHAPPISLAELPPIEGLILSHDHYDHLDVETIEGLRERVQRYFVPLGVGARLLGMGVAAERIAELDWWQSARHAGGVAARAACGGGAHRPAGPALQRPHLVGPQQHAVGVLGHRQRTRAHLLQRRLRLLSRLPADRRTVRRLRHRADGERGL
jgi:hypothetical protein